MIDIRALQTKLASAGCACTADGVLGPMAYAAMLSYAASHQLGQLGQALGVGMAQQLPTHGITPSLGLAHWIAQTCHETAGYRYLTELGGPEYLSRYDGRADLGNTQPGDGAKFCGRGLIQITGRANYRRFGEMIAEPLEEHPELAAQPGIAVILACAYWADRRIEPLAEADDVRAVTRKINGGVNGLSEREALTLRMKRLFGLAA